MPSFFNTITYQSHYRKAAHYQAVATAFNHVERKITDLEQWPSLAALGALLKQPKKFITPHSSDDYLFTLDFSVALCGIATVLPKLLQQLAEELVSLIDQMCEEHILSDRINNIRRLIPVHQKNLPSHIDWDSATAINPIISLLNCTYWFLRELGVAQLELVMPKPSCIYEVVR